VPIIFFSFPGDKEKESLTFASKLKKIINKLLIGGRPQGAPIPEGDYMNLSYSGEDLC
jgi:hypothetical protein